MSGGGGDAHSISLSGNLRAVIKRSNVVDDTKLQELHGKLVECLNGVKLGVAGRLLYFDSGMFILGMHSGSPEKTLEASSKVWESIPDELKQELTEAGIGFAGKQI